MPCSDIVLRYAKPARAGGFSMLEVLIAIIVLTVGLLGGAALQASAMASNRDARIASAAVLYAREIGEMMRGNKTVALKTSAASNPYLIDSGSAAPVASADCFQSACTSPSDLASWQMADWYGRVTNDLPGARVLVCYDSAPYDASGTPQWPCTNSGGVAVVKIGWTRRTTDSGASTATAFDRATTPALVVPITAGSTQ
ncbi:type IV pilus modification protein PilV [Noviherbaspirillum pedocola]|uniref:Type IV pilus modification protein PilV n=1 Tax=Noviherbaspirillum pedocola TaxID=2801341 RepID=A0A934W7T9_9BURK|nr:type IV pilus modification protein PilV [Noviherbaspirillum pedocola]MBK4736003.1 type IV pilus modification protein PilV [Noviherbaspirillum pedocola]